MLDRPDKPLNENNPGSPRQVLAVCVLLLLAVGLVFGRTVNHEFINLDDDVCVSENPWVSEGLTAQSIGWAFTSRHVGNWDPLTWISHIVDWRIYGENAGGHHLTNLLLHAATAILLFLVLRQMTGRLWPSALAAALFAVHPLRVESVAWVTERKDVLSGLFFMLTLAAYVGYARHRRFSLVRYLAVIVLFALGLMSKPMLVTLPCVLLLLDYWPLRRTSSQRPAAVAARLAAEKIPLFALAAACCAVTVWAQQVPEYQYGPLWWRIGNAAISYVNYLGSFFYPAGLAPLCPRTQFDLPLWQVIGSLLILLGVTAAVFAWARKRPYLPVGWLWYLGMMFPVVGLVPFGTQAMADRFTYLPQIGLCIALVWGAADPCRSWPHRRWVCGVGSAVVLAALMACAWRQTSYWRDSETLWNRTIACTSRNYTAHNALGNALADQGRLDEATSQYRKALEIWPDYPSAHFNLGVAAGSRGRRNEAIAHYRRAIKANPYYAAAHNNLADALLAVGSLDEAIGHSRAAITIAPTFPEYHYTLGNAWLLSGKFNGAVEEYLKALDVRPDNAETHYYLAIALIGLGRREEAAEHYRRALEINPDVLNNRIDLDELLSDQGE
ncbi:MAG: tetratricopeptide repeat protein [Planctomycetes bacterium]|nr:tetratricopeptide repeat protein [Planctomycetota bacterium]MBU4399507.1 tetratricopeptide repeat protein [Planctomycetota bacterium]MCG2684903.1 tetratricopeptide repeat protein [Planctomycetales bacterium]